MRRKFLLGYIIIIISLFFLIFYIKIKEFHNIATSLSVILFITTLKIINAILGPVTCRSGWSSPSIGNRGACSHHGGVEDRGWVLLIAIIISVYFWFFITNKFEGKEHKKKELERKQVIYAIKANVVSKLNNNISITARIEKEYIIEYAIKNKCKVFFDYTDNNGKRTHRTIIPISLDYKGYFTGYCHTMKAERTFKIQKIENIKIEEKII